MTTQSPVFKSAHGQAQFLAAYDELARLTMPTLLLVGEQEFLYDGRAAVQRARQSFPNCRAYLIPQCNHAVVSDQTAILRAHLLDFLKPGTREA
jgi:pimeloyl-ACP methyl ester carboxylesterase